MIDIVNEIKAVQREVGQGRMAAGEGRTSACAAPTTRRSTTSGDALTDPERIGRWFLPISGDFRLGGRYQFEGNAGGKILGLSLHLQGGEAAIEDREAWPLTDEGREFHRLSSEAWGEASRATGADPEVEMRNVEATTAFYTTVPEAG